MMLRRTLVFHLALAMVVCAGSALEAQNFDWSQRTIGGGFGSNAVAVDGAGNVYVADFNGGTIQMLAAVNGVQPASPTVTTIATGLTHPNGLTVDHSGNLYVASAGDEYSGGTVTGSVGEIAAVNHVIPQNSVPRVLLQGLQTAVSVAVDASGDVFVADRDASAVFELPAQNGTVVAGTEPTPIGSGFNAPLGIAVDASGNVYVADSGNSAVKKIEVSSGAVTPMGSGFVSPAGVTVDANGNVFVTDLTLQEVREIAASNGAVYTIGSEFYLPYGITVDKHENVFVADLSIVEISLGGTDFGSFLVGQTSIPTVITFSFTAATTLNSQPYSVLTEGTTNLGFAASANQAANVCVATTYNAGDTCTVTVTFAPVRVGRRPGAVVLWNTAGAAIDTAYVSGTGLAPLASFGFTPPVLVAAASANLTQPIGMTVDGSGNVYSVSGLNGVLVKETLSGGTYTESAVRSNLNGPRDVAVDAAGNLYVTNTLANPNTILKETVQLDGSYAESVILNSGMYYASGIGVDGSGNVYVGNQGPPDGTAGYVLELVPQADGSYTSTTIVSNLASPYGITVDDAGSIYYGETVSTNAGSNRVLRETPALDGTYTQSVVAGGFEEPNGVAVDAQGSVYVADTGSGKVSEYVLQPDGTYIPGPSTPAGLILPYGIAVDTNGSIYTSDNTPRIIRTDRASNWSLSFPDTVIGEESPVQTLSLTNVGNLQGVLYGFTLDPIFTSSTQPQGNLCVDLAALDPGQSCLIGFAFNPVVVGPYTGTLVIEDNVLNAPASAPSTQTVTLTGSGLIAPTTTALLVNPDLTIGYGTPVTLTANVSPNKIGPTLATGTVTFYSGAASVGTATLTNGTASVPYNNIPVGTYNLRAVYSGDTNFTTSTSPVVVAMVVPAATTVTLSSSSITATYGQSYVLTASISETAATGTFQFYEIISGVNTAVGAPVNVANGAGSIRITGSVTGEHDYMVHYSGDANYAAKDSGLLAQQVVAAPLTVTATDASRNYGEANPDFTYQISGFVYSDNESVVSGAPLILAPAVPFSNAGTYPIILRNGSLSASNYTFVLVAGTLTINKIDSSITLVSSQNPTFRGNAVTFTAAVPTGADGVVSFMDGGTFIGQVPVQSNTAVLTTNSLTTGTHPVTAVYAGDMNHNAASSAVVNQVVVKRIPPVNTTVSGQTVANQPVILTAVVPASATGTITFYDGTTAIGTATVVNGVATLTTSSLGVGTHRITAAYSGDDNYTIGLSLPVVINLINPADFAVSSGTGPQTIPPGASAAYAILVASVDGSFTDTVTLTAAGLPPGASYAFSPASVVPGTSSANSTLTVKTATVNGMLMTTAAPAALAVVLLPFAWFRRRRGNMSRLLLGLVALLIAMGATGCGSGGYFNQAQQTYTITVTGTSGTVSHSTTVTLIVE